MKGYCENCKHIDNCRLEIGIVFGFCNTHFEPKEKEMKKYVYGMRLRGFTIVCQPMDGFIERRNSPAENFYDVIVYSRLLTEKELKDYDLTFIGTEEMQ